MKRADAFALVRERGGHAARGRHQAHRCADRRRVRLAAARRRPAVELARAGAQLRRSGRERAAVPRMARQGRARRAGQDLHGRPARLAEQAARARARAAGDVRPDRAEGRPLRLSRSRGRAPDRRPARLRRRAVGDHQEPARDPQVAARGAALEPAAVSGKRRSHSDRADAGPHRQDRPVRAAGRGAERTIPTRCSRRRRPRRRARTRRPPSASIAACSRSIRRIPPAASISPTCCARAAAPSRPRRCIARP